MNVDTSHIVLLVGNGRSTSHALNFRYSSPSYKACPVRAAVALVRIVAHSNGVLYPTPGHWRIAGTGGKNRAPEPGLAQRVEMCYYGRCFMPNPSHTPWSHTGTICKGLEFYVVWEFMTAHHGMIDIQSDLSQISGLSSYSSGSCERNTF
jgi:hypothetical protein